jgi:AcrR family transcriptional regulator
MNKKAEKILNTTSKLFLQNGAKKITMDDIAEQAKVSKVTVYKYFSDKDTLYYEVGKHILSFQLSKLNEIIESRDSLINRFYSYIDILSEFTDSRQLWLCSELTKFNDRLSSEYNGYISKQNESLLILIDEGYRSRLIKQDIDRQIVFHMINMGIVYYQQNEEYRRIMHTDSHFQKTILFLLLNGIFVDTKSIMNGEI